MNKLSSKVVKKTSAKRQKPIPVKIVSDGPAVADHPGGKRGVDKWEAKDALRTLQRAEEIKRNGALMKAARTEAKNQMKQLSSVCKR